MAYLHKIRYPLIAPSDRRRAERARKARRALRLLTLFSIALVIGLLLAAQGYLAH